ncbi:unnamed protein product [Pleuronectes platessa]|uniref:BAH domain-containing protein n=1 Tax=Pleuronectes platessa TaxID=8262 RepID=A0A9N7ZAI9_PLEPL|nr:unnamed protein product [Pleuronectes platessa]
MAESPNQLVLDCKNKNKSRVGRGYAGGILDNVFGQDDVGPEGGSGMRKGGDYVYFENSSSNPLLIRRIEELNKTANGNVEAKVVCFYRRRDISGTLIALADKHAKLLTPVFILRTCSDY